MPVIQIQWSSLLNLTELDFVPEAPKVLKLSDEMIQSISWLTGATGHDRRLLRCTDGGALLVADPWSNLVAVETDELLTTAGVSDTATAEKPNKGVLVSPATAMVKATFVRVSGGGEEVIYIPAEALFWYPHTTYSLKVETVPDDTGTTTYVGVTTFN